MNGNELLVTFLDRSLSMCELSYGTWAPKGTEHGHTYVKVSQYSARDSNSEFTGSSKSLWQSCKMGPQTQYYCEVTENNYSGLNWHKNANEVTFTLYTTDPKPQKIVTSNPPALSPLPRRTFPSGAEHSMDSQVPAPSAIPEGTFKPFYLSPASVTSLPGFRDGRKERDVSCGECPVTSGTCQSHKGRQWSPWWCKLTIHTYSFVPKSLTTTDT